MRKIILLSLLLFMSCNLLASYNVEISSFGKYTIKGKTFYIVPGDDRMLTKDLEFKQYTKYVASYIILAGGIETQDTINADMCVFLNYGIGDSKPLIQNHAIRGNTGISSITTTTDYYGNITSHVHHHRGVVGYYQTETEQYRRYIDIYAYNNHDFNEMLWKTSIESTGWKNDLRAIFPYMMYASRDYLGRDSKEKKTLSLNENITNEQTDILMGWVESGDFRSNNTIGFPYFSSESESVKEKCLYIAAIQRNRNSTMILIEYLSYDKVKFSEGLTLVQGEGFEDLKPIKASINLKKQVNKNIRYFIIQFDQIQSDKIAIIDSKNDIYWMGIETKQ